MDFTVERGEAGTALTAFLRARAAKPWSTVKEWVASGKVFVDGVRAAKEGSRLRAGQRVEVRMTAPRRKLPGEREVRIVFEDAQVVVIDKPAGVSSVPYQPKAADTAEEGTERDTAMDLVRDAWRKLGKAATATPLHVVHRIDKETSGLLVFAKTKKAETALAAQLRAHTMDRSYLCVAHGEVKADRIESRLVVDRGDGLRGSGRGATREGKRAITHVNPVRALAGATLCEVRLETGKTHQIRIHLSERGHPLVGEKVYIRDFIRRGHEPIESPRLLLHAATLGFAHPTTGAKVSFEAELPADFREIVRSLTKIVRPIT